MNIIGRLSSSHRGCADLSCARRHTFWRRSVCLLVIALFLPACLQGTNFATDPSPLTEPPQIVGPDQQLHSDTLPPNPPKVEPKTSVWGVYEPVWSAEKIDFVGQKPADVKCYSQAGLTTVGNKNGNGPVRARNPKKTKFQPHTSGHPIAVAGDLIHAVDRHNGTLVTLERLSMKVVAITAVGERPHQLVIHPDGTVFVTVRASGEVVRVAAGKTGFSQPIVTRSAVTADAYGLALSPDGAMLAVTSRAEGRVMLLDPTTLKTVSSVNVDARPGPIAIDTKLVVTVGHAQGPLTRLQILKSTEAPKLAVIGARPQLGTEALGPVCANDVRIATRVESLDLDPESGAIRAVHDSVNSGNETTSVEGAQKVVAFFPNGEPKPISKGGYGGSSGTATKCAPVQRRRPVEMGLTHVRKDGTVQPYSGGNPVLGSLQARDGNKILGSFGTVSLGDWIDQAADIRHHPTRALMFVVGRGSERIIAIRTDITDGAFTNLKSFDDPTLPPSSSPSLRAAGAVYSSGAPIGLAFSVDGKRGYVLHEQGFSVGELDLDAVASGDIKYPFVSCEKRATQFGTDPLPYDAAAGRRLFTYSLDRKVSFNAEFACSSCHPDGSEDGMVWHLNHGPRQTPALGGRVKGSGPFNWNGSEHTLVDNMQRTMQRMGGIGMSTVERVRLQAFIEAGLPSQPKPHREDSAELIAKGKDLFFDPVVGCGGCHLAGDGSDGKLHNVGTTSSHEIEVLQVLRDKRSKLIAKNVKVALGADPSHGVGYDTPSLRGLRNTAPYLHDGSATTLMDVLELTAGKMGDVTELSKDDKLALVAFLRTM